MIVCKFGGSSLASAEQIKRATAIMLDNPDRRIMVVSAPGKRKDVIPDQKITDLLLDLIQHQESIGGGQKERDVFVQRIVEIATGLELTPEVAQSLSFELDQAIAKLDPNEPSSRADVLAMGEIASAKLVTRYLTAIGVQARYVDPREAGLLLSYRNGVTDILPETYDNLAPLALEEAITVFPGFFGRTKEGDTITFSRGGSDISGAVLAAAVNASLYENWTDRDSVQAVNPELVKDAVALDEMSYREMRELAYIGFSIIHPEALEPVIRKNIPLRIANTDAPHLPGTRIVAERTHIDRILTGIAASDHFCSINLRRILINQEIGILAKILTIFSELGINVHHVPTGIDSVSVIVKEAYFPLEQELVLRHRLAAELELTQVTVVRQMSIVMLVGEGMRDTTGVMARASAALAKEKISIEVAMLDYFEIRMLFMMRQYEKLRAVSVLYNEFFLRVKDEDPFE